MMLMSESERGGIHDDRFARAKRRRCSRARAAKCLMRLVQLDKFDT